MKKFAVLISLAGLLVTPTTVQAQGAVPVASTADCLSVMPPSPILSGSPYTVCLGIVQNEVSHLITSSVEPFGGNDANSSRGIEPSNVGNSANPNKKGEARISILLQCFKYTCSDSACTQYIASPVPNCPLKFEFKTTTDDGSHDSTKHINKRPRGVISTVVRNDNRTIAKSQNFYTYTPKAGELNDYLSAPDSDTVSYQVNENDAGDAVQISYSTPEVSGLITFTGTGFIDPQRPTSITVPFAVAIPGLTRSSGYSSTNGGSWSIVSPADNSDKRHGYENNYATDTVLAMINNAVTTYAEASREARQPIEKIVVSDMSLSKGGMFDLNGKYYTTKRPNGHITHRRGVEVDFKLLSTFTLQVLEFNALVSAGFVFPVNQESLAGCVTPQNPTGGCRSNGVDHFHGTIPNSTAVSTADPTSILTDS